MNTPVMDQLPERIRTLRDVLYASEGGTCYERALTITKSFRATEHESMVFRRGQALYDILAETPLYIRPQELIVGARSARLGWESSYPEYDLELHDDWPEEVAAYWKGRTIHDFCKRLHPPVSALSAAEHVSGYVTGTRSGLGHGIVDYEKAITLGFLAVIADARRRLAGPEMNDAGKQFLRGSIRACEGIIAWAGRYADLAEEQAAAATPERRQELLQIARSCRHVPAHPARSYQEALQAFWFVHLALHIEQRGWSISTGRFDQYIYPFYKADVENGVISKEAAFELLLNLWVKFMENVDGKLKLTLFQNMTLGGQDAQGNDASNEFSHLCLDATMLTGFTQPALSVRWHERIDGEFWHHTMRTIATGVGMPALFNDAVIMRALTAHGTAREDVWNYGLVGCVEPAIPGKQTGMTAGGHVNVAKALELALNDGRSTVSGEQIGPRTGDAASFTCFEQLFAAYASQVRHLTAISLTEADIAGHAQKLFGHCPLHSSLLDDCFARGLDMVEGGTRYSLSGTDMLGTTNVCDGLLGLKKLVFEEGRYTMAEVCAALRDDFRDLEVMRQVFFNQPCRFGNDVAEADAMANRVNAVHAEFCTAHPDPRGGHYTCGVWPVNDHVFAGLQTGALPDGRHKGDPLSDGVGACHGADVHGPTALLSSVARLRNTEHWQGGNTCNVKFARSSVLSGNGLQCMEDLLTVFMRMGGQEVQVNVVNAETLRAARERPLEYADLVVRVAGYSAYFITLGRDIQNEVIARTEQTV